MNIPPLKKKKKKNTKQFVFVLGHPLVFKRRTVGAVVKEFTNTGLNLIGLRCMSVTRKFIKAHLQKNDRDAIGPIMEFVDRGFFLAMMFEGVKAVSIASKLVSGKKEGPFFDEWPLFYCSNSFDTAQKDATVWFAGDSTKWLEKEVQKEKLMFALPDGRKCGAAKKVFEKIENSIRIDFCLEREYQRFILIRPKAFQNGKMPELLCTIEQDCVYMKGLKLVKKSEVPHSVAWSDDTFSSAETDEEEFGIACIVLSTSIQFEGDLIRFKNDQHINREFVFVSEEADTLKFAQEFFEFGVVGWAHPSGTDFCGGFFESTLTGLLF